MRANKVQVSNVARDQGGDQYLRIKDQSGSWITIPLKFNGDIITIDLREPTKDEQLALRVNWLTPPMEDITPQSVRRSRELLQEYQLQIPGQDQPVSEEEQLVPQSVVEPDPGKFKRTTTECKALIGFPSEDVVEKALESTTQMQVEPVELERREITKQHCKK